jgi:hypothetical protein
VCCLVLTCLSSHYYYTQPCCFAAIWGLDKDGHFSSGSRSYNPLTCCKRGRNVNLAVMGDLGRVIKAERDEAIHVINTMHGAEEKIGGTVIPLVFVVAAK